MKRLLTAVLAAAILLAAAAVSLPRIVYGRSLRATVYEMKLRRRYAHPRTAAEEDARLESRKQIPEASYEIPDHLSFDVPVSVGEFDGLRTFALNPEGGGAALMYLHGGAYINNFNAHQWKFLNRLAAAADCAVLAPDYHLAPYGDCERAYSDLMPLYRDWAANNPGKRLILMGDSAGGGLALGLAEALVQAGDVLPERLILLSPWVDVSMDNPDTAALVKVEPMLHLDLMKTHGRWWAGALDTHDPRVSPLYGDMAGLPPVTLYCGTRELLYPDILLAHEKLTAAGVNADLRVGKGLNHDWPLMPIPEADDAVREIVGLVQNEK